MSRRREWEMIATALALLVVQAAVLSADEGLQIRTFDSDKVLYDFDEEVKLGAVILNAGAQAQSLTAEVVIKKGVDGRIELAGKSCDVPAGKETSLTFAWDADHSEYGHAAFLVLKDREGNIIAQSKPTVFEVCHDWRKIIRAGSYCVYHHHFDPDNPSSSKEVLAHKIRLFRKWGYNMVEWFGSYPPELDDLTPDIDVWPYWAHQDPTANSNMKKTRISKAKLKEWISGHHRAGIKVITYMHTPTYPIRDQSWLLHDPVTGERLHYPMDSQARRLWIEENGLGWPDCLSFCKDVGEKMAKAVEEYGWDGCVFDDYNRLVDYTISSVDKDGKPFTDLTVAQLHSKGLGLLVGPSRKIKDNFLAIPNGLHFVLAGIELFPSRDMFGENGEKFPWTKSAEQKCVFYVERRAPQVHANTPWQLGRSLRAVREATGVPVLGVFTIAVPKPWEKSDAGIHGENAGYTYALETVLPYTAVVLANGLGLHGYYTSNCWGDLTKDPVAIARVSYLKFAARYGQYLYDLNIHWTPKGMVEVGGPDHIYWKGNTFERTFADRREVYVHLINFDKMYLAAKLWDRTRTVPPKVSDIPVEIALNPGETEVEAFFVNADGDQEPDRAPVKVTNGKAEIIVPELEYWDLLVVKARHGKGK